jgi:hypothetical protein
MRFWRYILFLFALFCAARSPLFAQNAQKAASENRFLFVIDTSLSMARSSKEAQATVLSLINSGLQGQMRDGDTYGIWLFNEKLSADFPMQAWYNNGLNKTDLAAAYLKKIRYEKQANLDVVLKPLLALARNSRALTVIQISDGKSSMHDVRFDTEINRLYSEYAEPLRQVKMPFVTVLVVRDGEFAAWAVNSTLPPLRIPNPPISPKPDKLAAPKNQSTNAAAIDLANHSNLPLLPKAITNAVPGATTSSAAVTATNTPAKPIAAAPVADSVTKSAADSPKPASAVEPKPPSTALTNSAPPAATNAVVSSVTQSSPIVAPKLELGSSPSILVVSPLVTEPTEVKNTNLNLLNEASKAPVRNPAEPDSTPIAAAKIEATQFTNAPEARAENKPVSQELSLVTNSPAAVVPSPAASVSNAALAEAVPTTISNTAVADPKPGAGSIQGALQPLPTIKPEQLSNPRRLLWIAGLLLITSVFLIIAFKRGRKPGRPSLISRSMDGGGSSR